MNTYKLVSWLEQERYIHCIDGKSYIYGDENVPSIMKTEEFEREYQWQFSRNRMIEKTLKYLKDNNYY